VSALEDRLRRDLRAESGQITPDSLPDLRLPARAVHPPAAPPPWLAWARPLAAAAGVIAVIAGALAVSRTIQGQPPVAGIPPDYSAAPDYYAYTVQGDIFNYVAHGTQISSGVQGRYIKVRATSTGELLASVSPPKPYNDFSAITAAANGRAFVFGAMRFWQRNAGPSPRLAARNLRTPMVFLLVRIDARGHAQISTLSLPETLTPAQDPSIALSPQGTRLAVGFHRGRTAVVQVVTLGTGQARSWQQPRVSWSPSIAGEGVWTANGRTLAVREQPYPPLGRARSVTQYQPPTSMSMLLLDTAMRGGRLASRAVLVLHAPPARSAPALLFLTPDGTQLIGSVQTTGLTGPTAGELAVYSARTGALLHTLAAWRWPGGTSPPGRGGFPRPQVAWSSVSGGQLIVLQPRNQLNVLGVLSNGSFAGMGAAMLPGSAAGYRELQYALRSSSQMTW
jgi:hypothetical protein